MLEPETHESGAREQRGLDGSVAHPGDARPDVPPDPDDAQVGAEAQELENRRWTHLRWMAPTKPPTAGQLAAKMASTGPWTTHVIPIERTVAVD